MRKVRSFGRAALFSCIVLLLVSAAPAAEKVIVDSDVVEMFDDGVAILMLANSPKVELLGITVACGNSWTEEGTAYALRQMELSGKKVPVAVGAPYPLRPQRHKLFEEERRQFGMGHDNWLGSFGRFQPVSWQKFYTGHYNEKPTSAPIAKNAATFIIDTVRAHPHEVTIAEIGPCTNLALAIRLAPDIVPLVKRIIYMGGAFFQQGNVTPAAEFNWWFDPEAAQIVVRSQFAEQLIFGLDACEKVVFHRSDYDRLVKTLDKSRLLPMLKSTFVGQLFPRDPNFTHYVWDVLVAEAIIDPSIVTKSIVCNVDVNTQWGLSYGQSIAFGKFAPAGTQKVRIVLDVDIKRVWDMINDRQYWQSSMKQ